MYNTTVNFCSPIEPVADSKPTNATRQDPPTMNTILALFSLWPGKKPLGPTEGLIILGVYVALFVLGHMWHRHEMKKAEK